MEQPNREKAEFRSRYGTLEKYLEAYLSMANLEGEQAMDHEETWLEFRRLRDPPSSMPVRNEDGERDMETAIRVSCKNMSLELCTYDFSRKKVLL